MREAAATESVLQQSDGHCASGVAQIQFINGVMDICASAVAADSVHRQSNGHSARIGATDSVFSTE